ncbi:MAG TPA: TolC family protein, partial [Chitinophagaceae bacterium]|nr:TolC family protein [Chitinophagaceae bacterium]
QLVISKTSVAQIDANIARLQKLKHDAEALFKNGFAEKLDVDRTEVQLANLLTQKRNTDNLISNGYLGLKMLIGMPMADTLVLTDTVTDESLKEGLLNEGIYQYTDRNDYQYLQFVRKLNDYNVRRYKLTKIPSVSLSSGYSKLAQRNEFSFLGKGDWFSSSYVGLNINIPIFKGFATNANIKTAQLQLQQTQNQIDNLKIAIDNEVNTAENNYHNAVASIDAQLRNVKLAEEVYNQTQKKYQAGLGTTTDISNAQADLIEAQQNYTAALYDAAIAKIDYLKAIGKLP